MNGRKIKPSSRKHQSYEELFGQGGLEIFGEFMLRAGEYLLQRSLEQEAEAFANRGHYERSQEQSPRYRNGYYPRQVRTSEGRLHVEVPRFRPQDGEENFQSEILQRIDQIESRLMELALNTYVRGCSTRDVEQTFTDQQGGQLLSKSSVSLLNQELYEEYRQFKSRDLSQKDVVYMFVDGVYEAVRNYTNNQALLCAWGIMSDGTKEILHLEAVESESSDAWTAFFEHMLDRGLRHPLLICSDGAKGAHKAIGAAFPMTWRQRCIAHKLRNLASKCPKDNVIRDRLMASIKLVYNAGDYETAEMLAAEFIQKNIDQYPSVVECFQDDLEACIIHLKFPPKHHRYIRTTNLLERAFEEQKRRTKVFPQHQGEKNAMGLVFRVLFEASEKWRKITMDDLLRVELKNIRKIMHEKVKRNCTYSENSLSFKTAA